MKDTTSAVGASLAAGMAVNVNVINVNSSLDNIADSETNELVKGHLEDANRDDSNGLNNDMYGMTTEEKAKLAEECRIEKLVSALRMELFGKVDDSVIEAAMQMQSPSDAAAKRWLATHSIPDGADVSEVYHSAWKIERVEEYCETNGDCDNCPSYGCLERLVYEPLYNGVIVVSRMCKKQARHRRSEITVKRIKDAGVPGRFVNSRFSDFTATNDNIVKALNATKNGRGMLITGSGGTGKTMLASIAVNGIIRSGGTAIFRTAQGLSDWMRQFDKSHAERVGWISEMKCICIDAVGEEQLSPWWQAMFSEIVTFCKNEQRALILTSELNVDELTTRYGGQTMRRLLNIVEWLPL